MKTHLSVFIVFLFIVVSIASAPTANSQEEENQVVIPLGAYSPVCSRTSTCYVPNIMQIEEGDKVVWVNGDYAMHTVTSGNLWSGKDGYFESEFLNHLDKFEFTFSGFESGVYPYYCIMHPWMKGLVSIDGQINFVRE